MNARTQVVDKIPTESIEQINFVKYLRLRHPTLFFYSSANAGQRSGRNSKRMKDEGMRKGVPDLCFPSLFLYIEMKRLKHSYMSDSQKAVKERLESFGYKCCVCRGCEDAIATIVRELEHCDRSLI